MKARIASVLSTPQVGWPMQWLPEGWMPLAIAVDIDGTITDSEKRIHTGAIHSLRRLEEAGIPIILCTGNTRAITYGLWRFLALSGPIVCENGGVIWHPSWEKAIVRADGGRARRAAFEMADDIGVDATGITTNAWRESEWCLFPHEDLTKIEDWISASKYSDLSVVRTGFAIHLMEPQLSKGEGLKIALSHMGINPNDVLAIGDAPNDIPMFELAGHAIAVGGSFDSLAAIADVVSPHMHGDTFEPLVDSILKRH